MIKRSSQFLLAVSTVLAGLTVACSSSAPIEKTTPDDMAFLRQMRRLKRLAPLDVRMTYPPESQIKNMASRLNNFDCNISGRLPTQQNGILGIDDLTVSCGKSNGTFQINSDLALSLQSRKVGERVVYTRAMELLRNDDTEEAGSLFLTLALYGRSPVYTALSVLRLGDTARQMKACQRAIFNYMLYKRTVLSSYYSSYGELTRYINNGYVDFFIGYCYWRQIPGRGLCINLPVAGKSCMFPPPEERSMHNVQEAYDRFYGLSWHAPDTEFGHMAVHYYRKAVNLLAKREMYGARFYWRRGSPMGTVLRLQRLLINYPESDLAPEARLLMARACLKLARRVHTQGRRPGLWAEHEYLNEARRNISMLLISGTISPTIKQRAKKLQKVLMQYDSTAATPSRRSDNYDATRLSQNRP